jgi:hypothetical protein
LKLADTTAFFRLEKAGKKTVINDKQLPVNQKNHLSAFTCFMALLMEYAQKNGFSQWF